jgi:tellurite methyltransferase
MSSSPFIVEWIERIARPSTRLGAGPSTRLGAGPSTGRGTGAHLRALDVAMGRGRHAVALAREGCKTFGVDLKLDAVCDAAAESKRAGVCIHGWCADLTQHPLPRGRFDLVVVSRYLQRDLFDALRATLMPGGVVIYETFTTHQRQLGRPPTSPDHLLEPGELRQRFEGFELLFYEEVLAPDAMARLVARSRRP